METGLRQVTIIDELWNNEELKDNRRLYDEQERGLQRKNIELSERNKKLEKQIEQLKQTQSKDQDKDLAKRALSKQTIEHNKLLAQKNQEIEQLNEHIKQLSKSNLLASALRQSNIEKLHLEKRLLSSTSSLNTTTTTNIGPSAATSMSTLVEQSPSSKSSGSSVFANDPVHYEALKKMNEDLKKEIHRLMCSNDDNLAKLKLQLQQYDELEQAHRNLETKHSQLLDIDERYQTQKNAYDICLKENEQLKGKLLNMETEYKLKYLEQKEKTNSLENELLIMKSSQNNQQTLQSQIEQLQKELQLRIKDGETTAMLNEKLRRELANINQRSAEECENLRRALIAKSDEFDLKQRENEQLKMKNIDLESIIKSFKDTNDLQKRFDGENELNKQELKKKQDDIERLQKLHDMAQREHQTTIHTLQEKIHDLERKTELQSLKYEEIHLQLESLKNQQHPQLLASLVSSQTVGSSPMSPKDDSAPVQSPKRSSYLKEKSARVVVAKYSYEPLQFSPNEHPEAELPLKLGEYYIVYGNVDEDGFYEGRSLDGRYGLIPSNFIELVKIPNDLPEHVKHLIPRSAVNASLNEERVPSTRESVFSFDSDLLHSTSSLSNPRVLTPTNSNLSDSIQSDVSYGKNIPHPLNLRIEKHVNNSVLIAWDSPQSSAQIFGYQIMFDGTLYTTIHGDDRTRVLIENIRPNEKCHRISIRSMTQFGLSRDQQCTLLLTNNNDVCYMPTDLRIDRIHQTSAVVSWWPASNDLSHKLSVNEKELQSFKPGIYRCKITNLLPNATHKVTIQAKPTGPISKQQQLSTSIEFRTASFDESIEPPRHVHTTSDPLSHAVRISWELPSPMSKVRGYRVLIDGRQVLDITNPLNDHTIINPNVLRRGRFLTMRTLTDNGGESRDSTFIDLDDALKKNSHSLATVSPESSPNLTASALFKTSINGKEMSKSLLHPSLESPSVASSTSTDLPQVELNSTASKATMNNTNSFSVKQHDYFDLNKKPLPTEQSAKNQHGQLQSSTSLEAYNHLHDKTNTKPRLFVALFDYDPQAMSPNQNSEDELPFRKGQTIRIFGDQDADGFYIGETENGRSGFVPSNMVSEIEPAESESGSSISRASSKKRSLVNSKSTKKMVALNDYVPTEHSSKDKTLSDELAFHAGDIVYIHGSIHSDGFYSGELESGKKGLVPANYLKEVSDENSVEKSNESNDKQPSLVNENTETKTVKPAESSAPVSTTQKLSFFDRLKNTFSWNLNEPI